jgi:hypothetical protein
MSIEAMRQALEYVQEFKRRWWAVPPFGNKVNKATREAVSAAHSPIFQIEDALRAAIEQAQKQEPVAWMYEWDGRKHLTFTDQRFVEQAHPHFNKSTPLYASPRQEPYDQTSLELCKECGWKAVIPGDGCLVCARQKAKPAAWVYPEFWDHLKQVNCGTAYRLPGDGMQPLYTAPAAPKPLRWVDTIIPGDRVIDNDDKTQARVSKLIRQRPAAPDYFKLEFDDGSYIGVTDNEMIANYKPLPESRKPVAYVDERIHGWPDCFVMEPDPPHTVPLYTAPRQWVELTDQQVLEFADKHLYGGENYRILDFYKSIEAKLKNKNA